MSQQNTEQSDSWPVTHWGQRCGVCGAAIYGITNGVRTCGHGELDLLCFRPEPCDCRICEREAQELRDAEGYR